VGQNHYAIIARQIITIFMFKKIIVVLFLICVLGMPVASYAAMSQMCWTENSCLTSPMGGSFYGPNDETISVCGNEKDASGAKLGFCMPVGQSETAVNFGGKQVFTHFGDFVKWIYKYGVQVAGILAVVMIIVAGFGWVTSGGSPEKITSAKKKIGGAMMGLFLAVMSYFILNLVNPYLVNLRMPKIWKINASGLAPPYCDMVKGDKKVSETKGSEFKTDPQKAECGKEYYVQDTPDQTCNGTACASDAWAACLPFDVTNGAKTTASKCWGGALVIHYKVSSMIQNMAVAGQKVSGILTTLAAAYLADIIEIPGWFDMESGAFSGDYLVLWCSNGSGQEQFSKKIDIDAKIGIQKITKQQGKDADIYEYVIQYIGIPELIKNKDKEWGCPPGSEPNSFSIRHEVKIKGKFSKDANLFITPNKTSPTFLIGGTWSDHLKGSGFLISDFESGKSLFREFTLTDVVISDIIGDPGSGL